MTRYLSSGNVDFSQEETLSDRVFFIVTRQLGTHPFYNDIGIDHEGFKQRRISRGQYLNSIEIEIARFENNVIGITVEIRQVGNDVMLDISYDTNSISIPI